jgi:hypothetical protein
LPNPVSRAQVSDQSRIHLSAPLSLAPVLLYVLGEGEGEQQVMMRTAPHVQGNAMARGIGEAARAAPAPLARAIRASLDSLTLLSLRQRGGANGHHAQRSGASLDSPPRLATLMSATARQQQQTQQTDRARRSISSPLHSFSARSVPAPHPRTTAAMLASWPSSQQGASRLGGPGVSATTDRALDMMACSQAMQRSASPNAPPQQQTQEQQQQQHLQRQISGDADRRQTLLSLLARGHEQHACNVLRTNHELTLERALESVRRSLDPSGPSSAVRRSVDHGPSNVRNGSSSNMRRSVNHGPSSIMMHSAHIRRPVDHGPSSIMMHSADMGTHVHFASDMRNGSSSHMRRSVDYGPSDLVRASGSGWAHGSPRAPPIAE